MVMIHAMLCEVMISTVARTVYDALISLQSTCLLCCYECYKYNATVLHFKQHPPFWEMPHGLSQNTTFVVLRK